MLEERETDGQTDKHKWTQKTQLEKKTDRHKQTERHIPKIRQTHKDGQTDRNRQMHTDGQMYRQTFKSLSIAAGLLQNSNLFFPIDNFPFVEYLHHVFWWYVLTQ